MLPTFDQVTDGRTFLNPLGVIFTLAMCLLLVVLPRRFAFVPILALVCYMTMGVRLMVGGLNFTMLRILLLFGCVRIIFRSEWKGFIFNSIDRAVLCFSIFSIFAYAALWGGEYEAFKYRFGKSYDYLGFYFLFRCLISGWDEAIQALRIAAVLVLPLAIEMVLERITLVNQFAIFGGVLPGVWVRDGVPRCQGPFSHPILAGSFGATFLPLFAGLWTQKRSKALAALGMTCALTVILMAGSSGPVMASLFAVIALCMWPLRWRMREFRWALVLGLVALHLVMKAPVWFLIAKVSVYNASTGFHRAYLIDRAIANFGEWWVMGTRSTGHWGYHLYDVTNQYIAVAVDGGVVALAMFLAIMVRCFRGIGRLQRACRRDGRADHAWLTWALGACLISNATTFISVSYFDQNLIVWFLLQAIIASLCATSLDKELRVDASKQIPSAEPVMAAGSRWVLQN